MGRRRGRTGPGGAVVSSSSGLSGGVMRGGGEDKLKDQGGGGWTGKTPIDLLKDYCVRNKRLRPHFKQMPRGSFKCVIPAGKKGDPPSAKAEPPSVVAEGEDEQLAALAALVQVENGKPLHRILPPQYRDKWRDWESSWNAREKEATERVETAKVIEKKKSEAAKKRDRKVVDVTLTEKSRIAIEDALLLDEGEVNTQNRSAAAPATVDTRTVENLVRRLGSLGFAASDAEVAARRNGGQYQQALDWLCMNLDESELPKNFVPKADLEVVKDGVHVNSSAALAMARRYASSRLAGERALRQARGNSADAVMSLFESVVGPVDQAGGLDETQLEEAHAMRLEEADALEAIYEGPVSFGTDENGWFQLEMVLDNVPCIQNALTARFRDVRGSYPYSVPAMDVNGEDVPTSTRRAIMRAIVVEVHRIRRGAQSGTAVAVPIINDVVSYLLQTDMDGILADNARAVRTAPAPVPAKDPGGEQEDEGRDGAAPQRPRKCTGDQRRARKPTKRVRPRPTPEMLAKRRALPAWQHQKAVVDAVAGHQVFVVSGATGSGKTTQIPQFILDGVADADEKQSGPHADDREPFIIVTQPRRLAAVSVAGRVASERNQKVGEEVGYQVRLDSKLSASTNLLFCTTGILLRRLQGDRTIRSVTHVVVDEVHERSIETDILLLLLREVLTMRKDLRVVLMSATLDAERFAAYFSNGGEVPIISIKGRTYPVDEYYLEDAIKLSGFRLRQGDTGTRRTDRKKATEVKEALSWDPEERTLQLIDEAYVNLDLIQSLVTAIDKSAEDGGNGSILVFLPGIADIRSLVGRLSKKPGLYPVPLHALLSADEQSRAFGRPPGGSRKVVCSTNVAETSVTVEDVVYVVDTVRAKISGFDALNRAAVLEESFISKASAKQRAGRAGRVRHGVCYRLVKRESFGRLRNADMPELQRSSLDGTCLGILATMDRDPREMLGRAVDPPKGEAVDASLENLLGLGAVVRVPGKDRFELTALGAHLATLPTDVRIGKLLIYASLLGCTDHALSIAAAMAERSPFQDKTVKAGFNWAKSDLLTLARLYESYRESADPRGFCEKYSVSRRAMSSIDDGRKQLASALSDAGFSADSNANGESTRVIKAVLCAALYPNVARVDSPAQRYKEVAGGSVVAPSRTEARELKLRLRNGQRVFLDGSSVNFDESVLESGWLVFNEKLRRGEGNSAKTLLRDSTMISAFALLLFGGDVDVQHERGILTVDRWIEFKAPARTGVLVKKIRSQLDALLWQKIGDPGMATSGSSVLDIITKLVKDES